MKRLTLIVLALTVVVGCTKAMSDDDGTDGNQFVAGFNPPPAPAGYKRYITPAVHMLQPGQDLILCQWIDEASASEIDIADLKGYQSVTGHHVVLYSSSESMPVGFSRECTSDDMVSVQYLGGVGGEGTGTLAALPPGFVFRHGKGRTLMANVHYLNATDNVQEVQSVLDIKMAPPSPDLKPAGMAVINYLDVQIPANTTSYTVDAYCTWPTDTSILMWSNHMHENGLTVYSEAKRPDGTIESLVTDASWKAEEAFNPAWKYWDVNAPTLIHGGDEMHVSCTWKNPNNTMLSFPDEMCDAVGFYAESGEELICDGQPKTVP